MDHVLSRFRLAAAALLISALLGLAIAGPVNAGTTTDRRQGGHADIPKWWQFDKIVWQYGWWHNRTIEAHHELWHRNHPRATTYQNRKVHRWFRHEWRYSHFHKAIGWQSGDATWYDKAGSVGACGVRLEGLYAASRTRAARPAASDPGRIERTTRSAGRGAAGRRSAHDGVPDLLQRPHRRVGPLGPLSHHHDPDVRHARPDGLDQADRGTLRHHDVRVPFLQDPQGLLDRARSRDQLPLGPHGRPPERRQRL